jgi:gamma-glutamyltranspeptidase/glutathione hydrolase
MDRARALATASEGSAAEVASAVLSKGNAVDAVVAAVFAAAAAAPDVLLGPVQMLYGGAGLGLRAVDGRVRQPGKGAPRPRGFTADQVVAAAARVGVPTLPAALAAALASSGSLTLTQALAPAVSMARGARKDLLRRIAQRGPSAIGAEAVASELVAACGRVAGGLVTRDDLDAPLPAIVPAREANLTGAAGRAAFVPWREGAMLGKKDEPAIAGTHTHVVAAIDHRGLVALACYERAGEGIPLEALDLVAPFAASPVLRGRPRVRPGTPVPAAAPIALAHATSEAAIDMCVGIAGDGAAEELLADALQAWSKDADVAPAYAGKEGNGTLIGAVRRKNSVSLLARRA